MATRELKIEILGDASKAQKAFGEVGSASDQLEGKTSKLGGGFSKMAGLAAGAFAAAGVGAAIKGALDAAAEAQKVSAQTEAVLKSTGGAAGVTGKYVGDLAHSLQGLSGVSDETIQSGQNMLLTFTNIRDGVGKGNDIFTQATKTMLDMSVAMGQDASQTAIQMGKALNDPVKGMTALSKVGVTFTADQKDVVKQMIHTGDAAGAQRLILAELNREFGGSAKAAGDAMTPMERLSMKWGDMQEVIGAYLLPKIEQLVKVGGQVVEWAQRNSDVLVPVVAVLGGMALGIGVVVGAMRAWSAVQAVLNVVMTANPIGIVVVALAALGAGLVIAYQRSDTFRRVVETAFGVVMEAAVLMKNVVVTQFQFMVNTWLATAEWIVRGAASAFGWVPGLGGKLRTAAKAVEGFRDEVNSALNGIKAYDPTKGVVMNASGPGSAAYMAGRVTAEVKKAAPVFKAAGASAGGNITDGMTDALDKGSRKAVAKVVKTAKDLAAEVRGQVGDILGTFSAMGGRSDAQRAVVAASESLNEVLARQATLPVEILRARRELTEAQAEAAKTTTQESLAIVAARRNVADAERELNTLRAGSKGTLDEITEATLELTLARERQKDAEKELVDAQKAKTATTAMALAAVKAKGASAEAEKKLATLQKGSTATAEELEYASLKVTAAREDLTQAQKDAVAPTEAVSDAEQKLKDLLDEQEAITKAVTDAKLALSAASRAAVAAELAYAEAAAKSRDVTKDAVELFRQLAEKAGLSSEAIGRLSGAFGNMKGGGGSAGFGNLGGGAGGWTSPGGMVYGPNTGQPFYGNDSVSRFIDSFSDELRPGVDAYFAKNPGAVPVNFTLNGARLDAQDVKQALYELNRIEGPLAITVR